MKFLSLPRVIFCCHSSLSSNRSSEDPSSLTTSTSSTIAECIPYLLHLTPCAPFVQGVALLPVQSCCDHVKQIYQQKPGCLCILLNSTSFGSFLVNKSLALHLPSLCKILGRNSRCQGDDYSKLVPPVPSPAFPRTNINSSIAASPMKQMKPRPTTIGLGIPTSNEALLKIGGGAFVILGTLMHALFYMFQN